MKYFALLIFAALLGACQTAPASAASEHAVHAKHDEPRPYDKTADAWADVKAAMNTSKGNGHMTIVAMGANWCHDSRGLAAQFEKPRFQTLLNEYYELVYVDVGEKNRNVNIARHFGVDNIAGTPTVFVLSPEGNVLNLETAPTWRNAASRSEDDIFDYFRSFTHPPKEN